jgi:ferritin-like metal-binding protein YciE
MAKAAQSADLRAAFEKHARETEGQVERLERVFVLIEEPAKGKSATRSTQFSMKDHEGVQGLGCP